MLKRFTEYVKDPNKESSEEEEIPMPKKELKLKPMIEKEILIKYCDICDKKLLTEMAYEEHLKSIGHKKKLRKITLMNIWSKGSIRRFLIKQKMISKITNSQIGNLRYLLYSHKLRKMFKDLPKH
ncbi:MAG: hypothetical protein MJ252_23060 [archaeon]|nr:hypothetical protein [archaeon]